jgi:hypothetical protein
MNRNPSSAVRWPTNRVGELCVRVNRDPRPDAADALLALACGRDVLVLRVDEVPNLIALDRFAGQIIQNLVLVGVASLAKVHDQPMR